MDGRRWNGQSMDDMCVRDMYGKFTPVQCPMDARSRSRSQSSLCDSVRCILLRQEEGEWTEVWMAQPDRYWRHSIYLLCWSGAREGGPCNSTMLDYNPMSESTGVVFFVFFFLEMFLGDVFCQISI